MELKRIHPNKKSPQVGRGGKRGKTSGRGTKGQKARAGNKIRPALRDIIKKIPRLRGTTINKRGSRHSSVHERIKAIPLYLVEKSFSSGEAVNPKALSEKGLLKNRSGRIPTAKIVGNKIDKKLSFSGVLFTEGAQKAIKETGGTIS